MTNPLVPSDVVKAIQDSVSTDVITIDGNNYLTRPVHLPPAEPTAEPLTIHALDGFAEFAKVWTNNYLIHVVNQSTVKLVELFIEDRHRIRECLAIADCTPIIGRGFRFGEFMSTEQFVINLQAQFVPSEARAQVLTIVGNIRHESVKTLVDDGITQQVTSSKGLRQGIGNVEIPNPVTLAPYRTFPELEQPFSEFILRLRPGQKEGELPQVALFEADGGFWKIDAIRGIRDYLATKVPEATIIA